MSDSARLELDAFRELETLVRHLRDEVSTYRSRALDAESRLGDDSGEGDRLTAPRLRERVAELERENVSLRSRLEAVTARTKGMLERVHFLRQQVESGGR